jgi:predicted TIM-barrel fold metal-dependent hydrolase
MELCQPPRPTTRPQHFKLPPLACDCHSHVFGPADRFPFSPNRSFTAPDALEEDYLRMLQTLGFERMIVTQVSAYGLDNTRLLAAIAKLGKQRARGVAIVDKDISETRLKELHAGGIRAVRFITTVKGGPGIEDIPAVARKVAPLGWHIEIYVPGHILPDLLPVIDTLPVPVVFDHLGSMKTDRNANDPVLVEILRKLETGRHWVKLCGYRASLSGYPYADVVPLARLFITHAPERCVWGTDWPHTNIKGHMPEEGELLDLLAEWTPSEAVRNRILADNPARLYRYDSE